MTSKANQIWHVMGWIAIYVLTVNVGDALSTAAELPENSATAVLLMILSAVLIRHVHRRGREDHYGLRGVRAEDLRMSVHYLPLAGIVLLQLVKGPAPGLDAETVLIVIALMVAVGFLEELIFRGMLYRALRTRRGVTSAILISGITFGVGHVVNLARGYSAGEQALQVTVGVGLGIVLALLFAVTGTIVPGIIFHVLLNIAGNLTGDSQRLEMYVVAATTLVCAAYAPYLFRQLRQPSAADGLVNSDVHGDEVRVG